MITAYDISASALVAQRARINTISSNMANLSTMVDEQGNNEPYQPKFVIFQTDDQIQGPYGSAGVKVSSVETSDVEPRWRYDPDHPLARQEGEHKGYVAYPNIDMTTQMVDSMEAIRAYQANIGVMEMTNSMTREALRILG
jgi:flagellar basal-body rod protein FlgC